MKDPESGAQHEDPDVTSWLRGVIAEFGRLDHRIAASRYSNLTQLGEPTQLYALLVSVGEVSRGIIVVLHDRDVEHGHARGFRFKDIAALASTVGSIDAVAGTPQIPRGTEYGGSIGVLASAALIVRELLQAPMQERTTSDVRFAHLGMQVLGTSSVEDAVWRVELRKPWPDPAVVVESLASPEVASQPERPSQAQPGPSAVQISLATFCEPLVWFGDPPFQALEDSIMGRPWLPDANRRVVYTGELGGVTTHFCNTGMIVAETNDRRHAVDLFNQFGAALDRSGVAQRLLSPDEIMEYKNFNVTTGHSDGGVQPTCRRNRIVSWRPIYDGISDPSYACDPGRIEGLLDVANRTMSDASWARESIRLLTASSLAERTFFSEAFVMAWSVLESALGKRFEALWIDLGRSKGRTRDMEKDWRAAQQIDLLIAAERLLADEGDRLHALRKRRNEIVHDLKSATNADTKNCIHIATKMAALPTIEKAMDARQGYL